MISSHFIGDLVERNSLIGDISDKNGYNELRET